MSLLTFFAEQRRRWFNDTKEWPTEHVDGGLSALLKAEVAFLNLPMYNVHLQLVKARQELDEATYKTEQVRKEHKLLAVRHEAWVLKYKAQMEAYKQLEKRAGQARRTLKRLAGIAGQEDFEPEVRLQYLQELLRQYFALTQAQEAPEIEDAPPPTAE